MSAEIKEPKKATKKKKSALVPVNGAALKKAIEVREAVKTYKYGEVWGARFDINEETFHVKRVFFAAPVESTEDLSNDDFKQKQLRASVCNKLRALGYHLNDKAHIRVTLRQVEEQMDSLRHDIQYDGDPRENHVGHAKAMSVLVNIMHEVNRLLKLRSNLDLLVAKGDLKKVPVVAPPPDEYHITKDGEFAKDESEEERMDRIDSEFGFEEIDPNDSSVPAPIRKLASKLGNCKTIKMARIPVKKEEK